MDRRPLWAVLHQHRQRLGHTSGASARTIKRKRSNPQRKRHPLPMRMQWEGSFLLHHNTRHWNRPPTTGGSSVEGERQTLGTRLLTEKTACFKPCKSACSPKKLPARNRLISGPAAYCVREREGKVSLLPFPRRALRCALRGRACPTAPLR